ncbi:methyltransferase type 11 [Streptomyces sp. NPDC002812]|uniref:methyltransferase type 11 n=1 Tax=unclassified Streptomyces TaxID=2593676 RepID=UPI00202EA214|nr:MULTISPECIES: methyltransferase type 11 [unclassified Streptomyces]MCM1970190.1 methyltransferase type 11 [Streptomyces sp. G1]MCX5122221.1 methyltransferase type 11 [Streptomyces sp. NBC_00347]MCX5295567.1 methyltransferase type 11 [Streptomyces sp. NBC_00193]
MTPTPTATLVARDWAEIQERMLVPLYEAVYDRLEVGPGDRLLGLDCGAGLALLLASGRGALATGVEADPARRTLARERLLEVLAAPPAPAVPYDVLLAFSPSPGALAAALPALRRPGAAVVLADWGPAERCTVPSVLGGGPAARDLDAMAAAAGLVPDGSGRVFCPFGYADVDSAVRGLLSTGLYECSDPVQVEKELAEALHPYERGDGAVWLPNIFRYVIARTA